jgi:hypothetical protein
MIICSVCFGDPTSPLTQGYNFGIMALLGVTFIVLAAFAMMFWNIRKRILKCRGFSH